MASISLPLQPQTAPSPHYLDSTDRAPTRHRRNQTMSTPLPNPPFVFPASSEVDNRRWRSALFPSWSPQRGQGTPHSRTPWRRKGARTTARKRNGLASCDPWKTSPSPSWLEPSNLLLRDLENCLLSISLVYRPGPTRQGVHDKVFLLVVWSHNRS
ncbi:hypothetical protein BDV06DRAFT_27860 [Aspergillus oleicola]